MPKNQAVTGNQRNQARNQQNQEIYLRRKQNRSELIEWLAVQPNRMVTQVEFAQRIGDSRDMLSILEGGSGEFVSFEMNGVRWVHFLSDHTPEFVKKVDDERQLAVEEAWRQCALLCGDVIRFGGTKPQTDRLKVIARTYTEEAAAKRLALSVTAIREAVRAKDLISFVDPENRTRIPAAEVEMLLADESRLENLNRHTPLKIRDIALVSGFSYSKIRGKLIKANLSTNDPTWEQVKGLWGLPNSLKEFNEILEERMPAWVESVLAAKKAEVERAEGAARSSKARNREERERLSKKLLEMFPTWENYNREDQRITLHLGPTNSGKTYYGISQLIAAGSGWYLAPLRLLAHEIYDTLNKRGVLCNLLTGEESLQVPGAVITAATIEMFNPQRAGDCVVIDEAHMLSDSQRGWAWTRAIMETKAPEVHIIGSPIVEPLLRRLAEEAGIPLEVENYTRLTPLEVAETPWSLAALPPKTIVVAFSRRVVLGIKAELEKKFNRKVSVVYGNLPPEVRLNQAERFAKGETDICVATDAIGMGLNLPADHVCFFETAKFDGTSIRSLSANEIRQIGGRAGRYGLSEMGLIGALNKGDLDFIRKSLDAPVEELDFAHVSPTPESIAIMPGQLSEKLEKWVELEGIPVRWKEILKPVDLASQISLARYLSAKDVKRLGEQVALLLINAPCYRETEAYWVECAHAIIDQADMPLPENNVRGIHRARDLESYEFAIRCADIYLWLSQRERFASYAPFAEQIRRNRHRWAMEVDGALQRELDTARRCRMCGHPLPLNFRYNICTSCFSKGNNSHGDYF